MESPSPKINRVNLLFGPPKSKADDEIYLSCFFSEEGKHIVCGGTTAKIVSVFLKKNIIQSIEYIDKNIPPIARIEGVDLVTEGIITLNKVLEYAANVINSGKNRFDEKDKCDAASQITSFLFNEADNITFYIGSAKNDAHEDFPIKYKDKKKIIASLSAYLKKAGKTVTIKEF